MLAVAQHSAVDKGWNEIRTKHWEGFMLTSEGRGKASTIAPHMMLWQRYLPPQWKRFSQNSSCNSVPHMADRNMTLLHDGLVKDVNVLFILSKQHNITHYSFYRAKTDPQVSWLNETKAFDALATELGGLYRSVEGTLNSRKGKEDTRCESCGWL
ncbi:hypothetical protein ERJ75_001784500 [Trypanosoma vivax]|nr:hypothetical protein ERJ75_001784500 [Trypanosoma vivax]